MVGRRNPEAREAATRIQQQAARPDLSVVLSASAGSGKTRALIDRFLRLCIEDPGRSGGESAPVHPRSVLAITFTRKAAVEIRGRLLARAVALAVADAPGREADLRELFAGRPDPAPSPDEAARAAGLHEMILEHPAGLKVGTIHHFCQLVLGRFAVEAGLDPRFTVVEDPDELMDEALDQLEAELAGDAGLAAAAAPLGKDPLAVRGAVRELFVERMRLERWLDRVGGEGGASSRTDLVPLLLAELRAFLFPDLPGEAEPEAAAFLPSLAAALEFFAGPGLDAVLAELGPAGAAIPARNPAGLRDGAGALASACRERGGQDPEAAAGILAEARGLLLTKAGALRVFWQGRKDPALKERYRALVGREGLPVLAVVRTAGHLELYRKNGALLRLGLRALDIYAALKRRDRLADFQDLEELARRLLGDDARALSLLHRLDDSLTHILVDEFQDTNFNQRDILGPFVRDFLAGGSGQTVRPTVFCVGDVKQSIYGFRGAEPRIFTACDEHFRELAAAAGPDAATASLTLPANFRSLPAVVEGVGDVFGHDPLAADLERGAARDVRQDVVRANEQGVFAIFPPFPAADAEGDGRDGDQVAADAAAALVRRLRREATTTEPDGEGRPVARALTWRDILVLVRSRTGIGRYEDAFRRAGIPIVPSGRGMLASSREVQDLLALLRWLAWPDDDVALATVLRSPLFRLDQQRFQEALARRGLLRPDAEGGYLTPRGLWASLARDEADPVTGPAVSLLKGWRDRVGFEHCHDLLRRIFREGHVLERFGAALGDQAVFNLLRVFDLTLGPEVAATPTVRRLADLIQRADSRGGQEEGVVPEGEGAGRVQFLTVHAAKGLEAPVVLLVDADRRTGRESPRVALEPARSRSALLFRAGKGDRRGFDLPAEAGTVGDPLQDLASGAVLRDRTEEANLLYVALTRARDRLYVLGGDRSGGDPVHDSPLRRLMASARAAGREDLIRDPGEGMTGAAVSPAVAGGEGESSRTGPERRVWRPPPARERVRILTPSDAPGAPTPAGVRYGESGEGEEDGRLRGLLVHGFLQAAAGLGGMPPGEGPEHTEAAHIFAGEDWDWIFRPDVAGWRGRSEVPVIGVHRPAAEGRPEERITGVIDRLVLRPGRADIVDFKTNRCAGSPAARDDLVDHYRPQLRRYAEVVAAARPGAAVRTWLLFTDPDLADGRRLVPVE